MLNQTSITPLSETGVTFVKAGTQNIDKTMALCIASDNFDICADDVASNPDLSSNVIGETDTKVVTPHHQVTKEYEGKELTEYVVDESGKMDVMVANVANEKPVNSHSNIRNAVNDFLVRCNFFFPVTHYDRDFHDSCCDVARGKGYPVDSPSLKPFIPGGVVMATTTYSHLQNKSTQILIALYTAFLIYIDDIYQHDVEGVNCFIERFILCQPQDDPVLDALTSLLREFHQHFGRVVSNIMITSTLNFMTSLLLDHETQGMPVSPKALDYPYFSRVMCGTSETYSLFAFPPEIPMKFYIQALPEMMKFFNNGNDILSFYKEELAGESINHISNMANCHGVSKVEILCRLSEEVATCHSKSLEILSPCQEAHTAYTKFSQGFIGFHASLARYRLSELLSHNA